MRDILDPVFPKVLRPVFKALSATPAWQAWNRWCFLMGTIAGLDGTGYFSSQTIHCASCLQKVHRNGAITYFHQMLGAAIIHPDRLSVIPLMPDDCAARGTAKRL